MYLCITPHEAAGHSSSLSKAYERARQVAYSRGEVPVWEQCTFYKLEGPIQVQMREVQEVVVSKQLVEVDYS